MPLARQVSVRRQLLQSSRAPAQLLRVQGRGSRPGSGLLPLVRLPRLLTLLPLLLAPLQCLASHQLLCGRSPLLLLLLALGTHRLLLALLLLLLLALGTHDCLELRPADLHAAGGQRGQQITGALQGQAGGGGEGVEQCVITAAGSAPRPSKLRMPVLVCLPPPCACPVWL
jgi:hypothetical protein